MELLQLKYFCDAAKTEKFSQTAKNFLVPVSNISQSVKRLEADLGIELFEHKGNKVSLSNAGKEFFSYAERALTLLECGRRSVTDTEDNFSGDIRLVCISNYGIVTKAVESFVQKHPNVNFIIDQKLEENANFDLLISDIFPPEHSKKFLLIDDEMCVAMSHSHPLADKKTVTVQDLKDERFITMTFAGSTKRIMLQACEEAGFTPNLAIQTYDTNYLRRYIKNGLGISFAPGSWRKKHSGDITFKPISNIRRKTYVFLPKNTYTRRAVEAFLQELQNEAKNPTE